MYAVGIPGLTNLKTLHLTVELPPTGTRVSHPSPSGLTPGLVLDKLTIVLVPQPKGTNTALIRHMEILMPQLYYPTRTLHLVDRQPTAFNSLQSFAHLTHTAGDPRSDRTPDHLIIEVDPDYVDTLCCNLGLRQGPDLTYIGGRAVPRITLINAQPDVYLSIPSQAIQGQSHLPREIEIIGFTNIERTAFIDIENLVSLHIDTPDKDTGAPWELKFHPGVTPTGSGFIIATP